VQFNPRSVLDTSEDEVAMTRSMPHSDQEYHTNGHIHSNSHEQTVPAESLAGIPISDPAAALQFCRALVQALTNAPTPLVDNLGTSRSTEQTAIAHPDLSVVIPVYNEEDNLPRLYERLIIALESTGLTYEIVFVDDGSRDESQGYLRALATNDPRVLVVELARNFGHQVAISAGLDHSRGQGVIVMDADLQDPPEVLPEFIAKWREGHDVVYAIREQRKEIWFKRAAYAAFYRFLQRVANIEIPLDAGDFCIMDRRVVDVLSGMPERNRFVRGIRSWVGLNQVGLAYERHARHAGRPKYTFTRLVYLALDGLVSFSYLPLRAITMLGFGVSLLSIILAVFYAIKKLTVGLNPPGFATITVAIFFLAGMQLITIGVIGEYVGRIFEEVKQRPLYILRQISGGRR
jgi:dolichol-phosphate mannosyltransferase